VGASGLSSLPRITNTTGAANSGDAVSLADDTDVENLVITSPYRGAIYGPDVVRVTVHGNDISGFDISGTAGFVVQPFYATNYIAGTGTDVASGIHPPVGRLGRNLDRCNRCEHECFNFKQLRSRRRLRGRDRYSRYEHGGH
jgi:hypothetical protein